MPVYIRFDGVDGSVRGSGNGGVWKTTNFLTADPAGPVSREPGLPGVTVFLDQNQSSGLNPRPKIKTYKPKETRCRICDIAILCVRITGCRICVSAIF